MPLLGFLDSALGFIFSPLLKLPPVFMIMSVSLILSVLIIIIYKLTTDQSLMKSLKDEMKEFQKEIKTLKNDPQKALQVQKKAMETNMKYMMHSFRSTIFTFIPIIILFSYFNSHIGYYPIMPDQEFTTTAVFYDGVGGNVSINTADGLIIVGPEVQLIQNNQATWTLKGVEGSHIIFYDTGQKRYDKDVLITSEKTYTKTKKDVNDKIVKYITINNEPVRPFGHLSFLGWKPGWLGTYIIFSMIFSMLLRKILKIY